MELRVNEIATLVGRNPRRVYAWLEDGTLPGRKIKGGIWVADTEDLDKVPGLAPITEPEIATVRSRLSPSPDAELPELPASIELARLRRQVRELQEQLGRAEWEREQWRSYAHVLRTERDELRLRVRRVRALEARNDQWQVLAEVLAAELTSSRRSITTTDHPGWGGR